MKLRLLLFLTLGFLLPRSVAAATYYVSTTGNDSHSCSTTDSAGTNKLTISAALGCASPGDTIYVHTGTYTGTSNMIDSQRNTIPNGSSGSPITIGAYCTSPCTSTTDHVGPGSGAEVVTLQPPSGQGAIQLTTGTTYLTIQDFILDGSLTPDNAESEPVFLDNNVTHIIIQRNKIENGSKFGVITGSTTQFVSFLHNEIKDNGRYSAPDSTQGHGLYWTGPDFTIDGNWIHDNQGYGLHGNSNGGTTVTRALIQNNRIWNNGLTGSGFEYGIVIEGGQDNVIINNLIAGNENGIEVYTNSSNTKVYNNTIYANVHESIRVQYISGNALIKQNIMYLNGNEGTGGVIDGGTNTGTIIVANNINADPGFTNASIGDYSLSSSSSPAADVAACLPEVTVDFFGTSRPQNSLCDAGALELSSPGPTITTASLPNGQVGQAYSQTLSEAGGTSPFTWSVIAGSVPAGTSLSSGGVLSGTPTTATTYNPTIQVSDGVPNTDSKAFSITISAATTCAGASTNGSWTRIANGCPGASSSNGTANAVTTGIDTTGADFAVCAIGEDAMGTPSTMQDSKSNTWTPLTSRTGTFGHVSTYYSHLTSVGASHTFTANTGGGSLFPAIQCLVFSGSAVSPLDVESTGNSSTMVTSLQAGSVTTTHMNGLVVAFIEAEDVNTFAIDNSFTAYQKTYTLGQAFGVGLGWNAYSALTTVNPTWSWSSTMDAAAGSAAFLSSVIVTPPVSSSANLLSKIRVR